MKTKVKRPINALVAEVYENTAKYRAIICSTIAVEPAKTFGYGAKQLAIAALCEAWCDADNTDADLAMYERCILDLTE